MHLSRIRRFCAVSPALLRDGASGNTVLRENYPRSAPRITMTGA